MITNTINNKFYGILNETSNKQMNNVVSKEGKIYEIISFSNKYENLECLLENFNSCIIGILEIKKDINNIRSYSLLKIL